MFGGRYNISGITFSGQDNVWRTRRVWRVKGEKRGVGERPEDAGEYTRGVRRVGRMGRVVGKRLLHKGEKGGAMGVFGRGSEGGGVSWAGAGRVWEERIRGRKASGGGGKRTGASGAAGGRGFALGVWLLDKLRQSAPGASGRKQVAPGRNEPGRKHPKLEFML